MGQLFKTPLGTHLKDVPACPNGASLIVFSCYCLGDYVNLSNIYTTKPKFPLQMRQSRPRDFKQRGFLFVCLFFKKKQEIFTELVLSSLLWSLGQTSQHLWVSLSLHNKRGECLYLSVSPTTDHPKCSCANWMNCTHYTPWETIWLLFKRILGRTDKMWACVRLFCEGFRKLALLWMLVGSGTILWIS